MSQEINMTEKKDNTKEEEGKNDQDKKGNQLIDTLQDRLYGSLDLKTRKWLLTTYEKCFVGSEAVSFMVKDGLAKTRDEAVKLGKLLLASGIIKHVENDHDFKDSKNYYRFSIDEKDHGSPDKKNNQEQWSWNDLIPSFKSKTGSAVSLQPKLKDFDDETKIIEDEKNQEDQKDTHNLNETFGVSPLDQYNKELLNNVHPYKWNNPKPQAKYNLIAIGAGAGGLVSSLFSAGGGGKTALIEMDLFGGDCLNSGCVPSKTLLRSAKLIYDLKKNGEELGLEFKEDGYRVNFEKVMTRVRKVRAEISKHDACSRFSKDFGIDVFLGKASFVDENSLKVCTYDVETKQQKVTFLKFSRCVIASGGKPAVPSVTGIATITYLTSHNVWNLTSLPQKLCVVGSGPIGCELAQSFALFGSEVHIFNRSDRILGKEDVEAAKIIQKSMEGCGIKFHLKSKLVSVQTCEKGNKDGKFILKFTDSENDEETEMQFDKMLLATGRKPNVNNMNLEKAKVKYDVRNGVKVDDFLQTSNSNVYAVGDCASRYQFTHMADRMARIAARNCLFFGRSRVSDLIIPWATYTFPEVAHVGLYVSDCKSQNIDYEVIKVELNHNDRSITDLEAQYNGFVKMLIQKGSDKIIGCTIVSSNAGDQISEVTLAMQAGNGLAFLANVIHPYPTVSEGIKAAGDAYNKRKLTPVTKALLRRILAMRR